MSCVIRFVGKGASVKLAIITCVLDSVSTTSASAVTKEDLVAFYEKHDPARVEGVDDIMRDFNSDAIIQTLVGEYDDSPVELAEAPGRKLSTLSASTLQTLGGLKMTLDHYEKQLLTANSLVHTGGSSERLLAMRGELAQLNGNIEKLQCTGIDAVVTAELRSGKTEAKEQRKDLTKRADKLQKNAAELNEQLEQAIITSTLAGTGQMSPPSSLPSGSPSDAASDTSSEPSRRVPSDTSSEPSAHPSFNSFDSSPDSRATPSKPPSRAPPAPPAPPLESALPPPPPFADVGSSDSDDEGGEVLKAGIMDYHATMMQAAWRGVSTRTPSPTKKRHPMGTKMQPSASRSKKSAKENERAQHGRPPSPPSPLDSDDEEDGVFYPPSPSSGRSVPSVLSVPFPSSPGSDMMSAPSPPDSSDGDSDDGDYEMGRMEALDLMKQKLHQMDVGGGMSGGMNGGQIQSGGYGRGGVFDEDSVHDDVVYDSDDDSVHDDFSGGQLGDFDDSPPRRPPPAPPSSMPLPKGQPPPPPPGAQLQVPPPPRNAPRLPVPSSSARPPLPAGPPPAQPGHARPVSSLWKR
jgi:hypothetical protein